jgi:diacylglycerol kinase (ATP)
MANNNQAGGLRRIWNAGLYSIAGIRATWKNEAAFRQELVLCMFLVPAAFWVGDSAVEYALLVCSCLFVLVVELLNSAVEAVVDRIGIDRHKLSGRAKDMGSAAVFISLWMTLICWGLVIYENFYLQALVERVAE